MRKKNLLHGKKLLAGFLVVSMFAGVIGIVPENRAYAAEQDDSLVYFVDCGDFNPETVPEGETLGSSQSVTDRIYGEDTTGKKWGVVTSETDPVETVPEGTDNGQNNHVYVGSKAVFTKYQWANQRLNGDGAITDSFRYARDQGFTPRYIKYQFDVEPGEYQVTVGMGNSWGNAADPDVYAGTSGDSTTDMKLNAEPLNIPHEGNKETAGTIQVENDGASLHVYALSQDATIQMNYIRIVKISENSAASLEITGQPDKTEYFVGEELDTAGLELQAIYKNGDRKTVEVSSCVLTGFDSSRAGEKTVTVSYTESVTVRAEFKVMVKKMPISISQDPTLAYFVDCGDYDPETTSQGDAVSASQSVTDRIYGEDKSGKKWGVVIADNGEESIAIPNEAAGKGSNAVFTTYQWANENETDDRKKEESFRYAHGQDHLSIRYVRYRFDVEPGEYQVAVMMGNTWGNAGSPDVYAGTTGDSTKDSKLNAETLNISKNGHEEVKGNVQAAEGQTSIDVYALSQNATIQMNYIRIVKIPKEENTVDSLEITAQPVKKEYFVGEKLDTSGMTLQAAYKNGDTKTVEASNCILTGFDSSKPGEQQVTVSYTEGIKTVQAQFTVTVKKVPITVSDDPNLVYFVDCGDFDPETTSQGDAVGPNQSVTDRIYGTDKNGRKWGVVTSDNGDEAIPIPDEAGAGSNAVYTTYQWANERQTEETSKTDSFRYAHGQDKAGIQTRYVKYRFDVEPGRYLITVGVGNTWGNAGNPDVYAGITGDSDKDVKLNTEPLNMPRGGHEKVQGKIAVPEGSNTLEVYVLSSEETVQVNYIYIEMTSEEENYGTLAKIKIKTPTKMVYYLNEAQSLNTEGMTVTAVYGDGFERTVPLRDCKLTGFSGNKLGTQDIIVTYTEGEITAEAVFQVVIISEGTVIPLSLQIEPPDKTEYQPGEELNLAGMVLTLRNSDGTERSLMPEACSITGFDSSKTGIQIITVTYTDENGVHVSGGFKVKVSALPEEIVRLVRLNLVSAPNKKQYKLNEAEELNTIGMAVMAVYSNGTEKELQPGECEFMGFQGNVLGTQIITISYTENGITAETTFQITVVPADTGAPTDPTVTVVPKSLKVTPPTKTKYQIGEKLNLEGMVILVSSSDGTEKQVEPEKCEISGFDSSKEGIVKITISYTEKEVKVTDFFQVEVVSNQSEIKTYRVFYHDNNGGKVSGMPLDSKAYGLNTTAVVMGTPVSPAKFFAGWNTRPDGKGSNYAAGNKIIVNEEIHLYAQWKTSYTAKNKLKYKVTGKQAVSCVGTANKKASSIKVPATIKYNGIIYKVTSIGAKAFAKNKKIKKAVIGNNVKNIETRAFENCKNLKSITIGTGLTTIEKNAFSGHKKGCVLTIKSKGLKTVKGAINYKTKNMIVKVPKSKLKAYKKLLKKKAKNVNVKAG